MNKLKEKAIEEIVKQVPIKEIYDDTMKSTLKSTGEVISIIPRTINAALEPLHKWIFQKEYNIKKTKLLLEKKLANFLPEQIVTPEPYVAVPALQAISYSMDNEEIRNMYANLLSASMISILKNDVHPAYVEIIKQLTPDEAKILKYLYKVEMEPIIFLNQKIPENKGELSFLKNFSIIDTKVNNIEMPKKIPELLENIERLKLINIHNERYLTDDSKYNLLENHETIIDYKNNNLLPEGYAWKIDKGYVEITIFGKSFCNICINDIK